MSRKKHTHQSKAEEHAEEVAGVAAVENEAQKTETETSEAMPNDATRFARVLRTAQEVAKKRLAGTRAEQLIEQLPGRVEKALDQLLDRVGLVRKSTLKAMPAE